MSWLPQRWRTQWNAIRHAICRIQWVIKTLNATCTSSEVCLLESLFIPTYQSLLWRRKVWRRLFGLFSTWTSQDDIFGSVITNLTWSQTPSME